LSSVKCMMWLLRYYYYYFVSVFVHWWLVHRSWNHVFDHRPIWQKKNDILNISIICLLYVDFVDYINFFIPLIHTHTYIYIQTKTTCTGSLKDAFLIISHRVRAYTYVCVYIYIRYIIKKKWTRREREPGTRRRRKKYTNCITKAKSNYDRKDGKKK